MQFIKRLAHDAKKLEDAIFGWDIFRCRDYSSIDRMSNDVSTASEVRNAKRIFGYTIVFAANIKGLKFFKRLFIKTI